jgi:hypothetical protein
MSVLESNIKKQNINYNKTKPKTKMKFNMKTTKHKNHKLKYLESLFIKNTR